MPQGRLSPLGRHLRTVLCNCPLSFRTRLPLRFLDTGHSDLCASNLSLPFKRVQHGILHLRTSCTAQSAATAAVERVTRLAHSVGPDAPDGSRLRKHGWRRLNRRQHRDHIRLALQIADKKHLITHPPKSKRSLTHVNVMSRHRWQEYGDNRRRLAKRVIYDWDVLKQLSLRLILARYIRRIARADNDSAATLTGGLTSSEVNYVLAAGFGKEDVSAWARVLSAEDSLHAVRLISERIALRGPCAIPAFVYMHLLRRPYISARALHILLQHMTVLFDVKLTSTNTPGPYMPSLFQAIIRLIRHAREVWPQAFPGIAELFIRHLERMHELKEEAPSHRAMHSLAVATHWLNKIMSLVSLSPAISPFKDNVMQEAAIVRVLRYMTNHDPPLHPNRDGYRAVIRLQLAQPKSTGDRLWAVLKTLSWPPWKTSRTAMDDSIGPEHGVSRAHDTLRQMQNAGYALLDWEKAVQAYTGWDADGTPTIQTRAVVPSDAPSYSKTSAKWLARIETTRTVQEAWACYLAWEDLRLPSDDNVHLAIFKKLLQEEKRQWREKSGLSDGHEHHKLPLLPGDAREIAPLPPSTHLYTYTRTSPPSVDDFYNHLRERGVVFRNHLLAFVTANASSLQVGIRRLEDSIPTCPEIRSLLSGATSQDLSAIPIEVFSATIKLFCRFAHLSPREVLALPALNLESRRSLPSSLDDQRLNRNHLVVRALELLESRRAHDRTSWNVALQGLTRESKFRGLGVTITAEPTPQAHSWVEKSGEDMSHLLSRCGSAILAYRLVLLTLTLSREQHMVIDQVGFRYLCLATENLAVSAWIILKTGRDASAVSLRGHHDTLCLYSREAEQVLHNESHRRLLKREFETVFGEEECNGTSTTPDALDAVIPAHLHLLAIPNPAQLHAYVRALGWLADYDGLYSLVRWMRYHREELTERMRRDRSGTAMMRRTLVAIRVFLERSWLPMCEDRLRSVPEASSDSVESPAGTVLSENMLQRFRNPATPTTIRAINKIVESVDDWAGWPSEQEVEEYCQDARFALVK